MKSKNEAKRSKGKTSACDARKGGVTIYLFLSLSLSLTSYSKCTMYSRVILKGSVFFIRRFQRPFFEQVVYAVGVLVIPSASDVSLRTSYLFSLPVLLLDKESVFFVRWFWTPFFEQVVFALGVLVVTSGSDVLPVVQRRFRLFA